jgi:DNA polymerase III delta prime subunit
MSDFDFQPYRDFILRDDGKRRALYTPTDALLPLQVGMIAQREQGESSPERMVKQLPVLEGLRKYALGDEREHVILAGKPGSGKSTALWQLRLALADEGLVPVLVQLKGNTTILEAIANELEKGDLELELRDIKRLLRNQKLILLLDGVNEIPTDDLRRGLAEFREQNATVPMVFTTRDLAVGGDLGIKQRLEMKPLTELQMQKFVGQRLPVDGEKLLGQLSDRLREIAETPLLLGMLCDVFGQTGQITESKGELFRLFDQEYDKFKGFPPVSEDSRRFKSEILQHLAFVMMTGDLSKPTEFWLTIDRGMAEREIEGFLIDRVNDPATKAKEWLEDLLKHHLLQVAADTNKIEFNHQLFQEYYAAEKLLGMFDDNHPDAVDKQRFQHFYLNYIKWTEAISILMFLLKDDKVSAEIIQAAEEIDYFLGGVVEGIYSNRQKVKQKGIFAEQDFFVPLDQLKQQVKSNDRDTVKVTIEALSHLGDVAIPALLEALRDDDPMNFMAAEALGCTTPQIVIPILLKEITDNDNDNVRWGSIRALSNLDGIRELDLEVGRVTAHRKHPLINSKFTAQVVSILHKCLTDSDSYVCSEAAILLGKIGHQESRSKLCALLDSCKLSSVRRGASIGLIFLDVKNLTAALYNVGSNNLKAIQDAQERIKTLKILLAKYFFCGKVRFETPVDNDELRKRVSLFEEANPIFSRIFSDTEIDLNSSEKNRQIEDDINCLISLVPEFSRKLAFEILFVNTVNRGFYNSEVKRIKLSTEKRSRSSNQTVTTIINAEEVKIFENVQKYYENPPDST